MPVMKPRRGIRIGPAARERLKANAAAIEATAWRRETGGAFMAKA
jgi:hypothetical protein